MNKNNILNSINRGISLALDDFEFNDSQSIKHTNDIIDSYNDKLEYGKYILSRIIKQNKLKELYYSLILNKNDLTKIQNLYRELNISYTESAILVDYFKQTNLLNREYVDLDLPSKTLWCTENLEPIDSTFILNGTEYSTENGSYYIWGDIKLDPKDYENNMKKLKNNYLKDIQNLNIKTFPVNLEDDAAYNVNSHYRIPSFNNFKELFENTDIITLKLDDQTKNLGYLLVSKINPFNFIQFQYEEDRKSKLYLTSELSRKGNKVYIEFAKLKQEEKNLVFSMQQYELWQNILLPRIIAKIRPIYIE